MLKRTMSGRDVDAKRVCDREGLAKELEATLGEKHQLGQELAALALKFEAAQSLWERQGASLAGLVTEEVLESIVQTLSERREQGDAEELFSIVDGDALAAKFQVPHNEAGPLIQARLPSSSDSSQQPGRIAITLLYGPLKLRNETRASRVPQRTK